jgi:hypothetical protein
MGWRSLNLHTHISLVHSYVYVEVPKAGCGTMKATLGGLEAARLGPALAERFQENPHDRTKATPFVRPFQLPPDLLEDALTSSRFRRFTVVREPAARLLSCYLEKIRQGLPQSAVVVERLGAIDGREISPADVTLAQFIAVVADQPSREQDPHWRRQADHLGLGIVPYDAVIHLEDLDRSWARIGDLIGVPEVREQFYCRTSTSAGSHMAEQYTPELLTAVEQAYARDYTDLGYPRP